MLSFNKINDEDYPIAHGFDNKECHGQPIFTVYFVNDYADSTPPAIETNDPKSLIETDRYRIQKEFSLSKKEFDLILEQVAQQEAVDETFSRTLKRAYLEIQRVVN